MRSFSNRNTLATIAATAALAAPFTASAASRATPSSAQIKNRIHQSIKSGHSLKTLYGDLGKEYGGTAIPGLLEIASDDHNADEMRWAALFGLARLAGRESIGVIKKFMSNSSWMLRDAALKTAAALNATELQKPIEEKLKDDALIVRTTAVEAIGHLGLKASFPKLVDALFDPRNFHGGKALWIHKHILDVFKSHRYDPAVPKLVELLEKSKEDQKLQTQVLAALESITGRSFSGKPLQQQIYLWKRNTLSDATF